MTGVAPNRRSCLGASVVLLATTVPALEPDPHWTADGNQASAHLGHAVAAAGDVNGDGFADLVVAARSYNAGQSNEGRVAVFHGGPFGPSLTADWTAEGDQILAFYGSSVAGAGDVNGDGWDDLLVGAPSWDGGFPNEGKAELFLGGPSGLGTTPAWTREGGQSGATFGSSVAFAGDVNGDGRDDILVGARGHDGPVDDSGRAYLFLGTEVGPDTTAAWTVDGDEEDSGFGWCVATAGDVDADGHADVLVGAFWRDGSSLDEGAAFLYLGSPGGPSLSPDWTVEGGQPLASLGWSLGTAGDVNGDGYADIVVGARHWDGLAGADAGRALVFHGGESGPDGVADWIVEGVESGALFGWSVGPAGDVDGNGLADVVVGAYREDVQWLDDGSARVFLGSLAGLDTVAAWTATSAQGAACFGWSVSGAGDVDGDGFADVAIGAYAHDDGQSDEGRAYLFRGGAEPPSREPAWRANGGPGAIAFGEGVAFAGDVDGDGTSDVLVADPLAMHGAQGVGRVDLYRGDLGGPDVSPDWTTVGPHADAGWGRAIASARDVNDDGYDDVLIGAPLATGTHQREGTAALFLGGPLGLAPAAGWQVFGGQGEASFGSAVAGPGDVNGDGLADGAVGAPGWSGSVSGGGAVFLYGGASGGLTVGPVVTLEGTRVDGRFGAAVAGAGDVNGDGLADLVVGAPLATVGEIEEGEVSLFLGSPAGFLVPTAWSARGSQADARFGTVVAPAGDVDADGRADVLVVAPLYGAGEPEQGRVFLYRGDPAGLESSAAWTWEPDQAGAQLDRAAPAGDVNGDGFDDVAVGVTRWIETGLLQGRVLVFAGSDTGLVATPILDRVGDVPFGQFGSGLAGRGDADGDGWPELLIGSRGFADSVSSGGAAFLFPANGVPGPASSPRQRRVDDSAPIALGGRTRGDGFRFAMTARSAAGRVPLAVRWEVREAGTSGFSATGTTGWEDPGTPQPGSGSASEISEGVTGLPGATFLRWRARVRSRSPWFASGPWLRPFASSETAPHLVTPGTTVAPSPIGRPGPLRLVAAPTPFRHSVVIRFELPRAGPARLGVYDVAGRRLARLVDGPLPAGAHEISWNGREAGGRPVSPGVYFVRLTAGTDSRVTKVTLLR